MLVLPQSMGMNWTPAGRLPEAVWSQLYAQLIWLHKGFMMADCAVCAGDSL